MHDAERWLKIAVEDLQAAEALQQASLFAQTCFYSQQGGEKAIKVLWYLLNADP